jgi:translin
MNPSRLEAVRDGLVSSLGAWERDRETMLAASHKCIRACSKAIQAVHGGRLDDAHARLDEARKALDEALAVHPGEGHGEGLRPTAQQEYVEAALLIDLVEHDRVLTPAEVGVPALPYALGVADLIGELRRRALDLLRAGDRADAERTFEVMGVLFELLQALEFQDGITPGLRRKRDVARNLVERTREVLTQAAVAHGPGA